MATPKLPIPPVPYRTPVTDQQGSLSTVWIGFFRDLFKALLTLQSEIDDIKQGPML